MNEIIREEEIESIVWVILEDFDGGKNIDRIDIYNKPDKSKVQDLVKNLFRIIYPGYFRDRSYKIYNPKNSFAVIIEDIFYHLSKEVYLALDYCTKRGKKRHPTICDNVTIYANASILGGDTVIGENAVIGGSVFITRSIDPNTRVSMKNLEMEYRTEGNERKSEELEQGEEWYYMI